MDTSTTSALAGLVQGYTKASDEVRLETLKQRGTQRDNMLQYLSHLASNPNVPPEHQQWALGKVQELIQADPSKKLPKVDMGELPPVSVAQPQRSTSPTLPQMTLQPPMGPQGASGGMQGAPAPPAASGAQGGPSGDVGTASNGTVNALGNTSGLGMAPPVPPNGYDGPMPIASVRTGDPGPANAPGTIVGGTDAKGRPTLVPDKPNFDVAPPTASLTLPAQPQATVVNQPPPVPISGKGQLHLLTPQDKSQYASAAQGEELNKLRQQFPKKSDEDLMHYAKTGEFPKDEYTLTPGEARYKDGKEVVRNTAAKPGEKSGFEPVLGTSGMPLGVKNVATGGMLTPAEVAADPHAKSVLDQAIAGHKSSQSEAEAKENRQAQVQASAQARAFAQQARMLEARGEALTANTKAMVEAVPKVQELSKSIRNLVDQQEQQLGPMSSRWGEFTAGAIGSPNPEFTKLRTDTTLLQTQLMRMHVGARGGEKMMDHFKQLIDSGKQSPENMRAALDEIDNYAKDVQKQGVDAKEATAAKAEGREVRPSVDESLPSQAAAQLQEGHETTFANGQVWTKRDGVPVKVR